MLLLVGLGNPGGDLHVQVGEGAQALAEHGGAQLGHARNVDQRLQWRLVAHPQADLGDAFGVVADALEFGGDLNDGYQAAQIGGHRGLQGDQVDAFLFKFDLEVVDLVVLIDDGLGAVEIAILEGVDGAHDGLFDHATEKQQVVLDLLKLLCVLGPGHFPLSQTFP